MMPFAEKLSFLMHITETSNKELAAELGVDPSLISLMRTGKRKLSKNPAQARKMGAFFARRSSAAFQRQALSEMLGQASISPSMPVEALASSLESWLQGDRPITDTFLSGIQAFPTQSQDSPPLPTLTSASGNQTRFFYGEAGRQEAMNRIMQESRRLETPGTIMAVVDDNLEWLLSNYSLTRQVQTWLLHSAEQGFNFLQIMPPLNFINRYTESLQFWLPVYATGQAKVYYYPRLRGNLYRHSMIVVPGCCVQYACSVAAGSTSDITMFSTDLKLVAAFEQQFREHLSLCRPSLDVYRNFGESYPSFRDYFEHRGESVQLINCLSLTSMPPELLERYTRETEHETWRSTFQIYLDNVSNFESKLEQVPFIDMCRLFTAEEVRSGHAPVGSSSKDYSGQPWYTPETYCLHLKNSLRLMEQYENYFFVPLNEKEYPDYDLFVNEGHIALIVRTAKPLMTLDVRRPPMVTAFREHLLRRAEAAGYDGIHREKARMELRGLIQELSN
ncbi:MAG: hypothetical protein J6J51_00325 [Clostridia bacterium]|nr:hypothetical protein [Clostridia bacterium]